MIVPEPWASQTTATVAEDQPTWILTVAALSLKNRDVERIYSNGYRQ
jgi:hypothetical protein